LTRVVLVGLLLLTACQANDLAAEGTSVARAMPDPVPPPPPGSGPPRAVAAPTTGPGLGSGKPVTFAFAGDVNFEGSPRTQLGEDPASVLAPVADALAADLTLVNLETAVTERGTAADKEFVFRAPVTAFEALRAGGVDVVNLGNNHGMDFGEEGLLDTLAAADDPETGLPLVGGGHDEAEAYEPHRLTIRGQRIAVFGATRVIDGHLIGPWTATGDGPGLAVAEDPTRLVQAVAAARPEVDTLIVFLHWGQERNPCPLADQLDVADALTAAGADVIVGSHAHIPLAGGMRDGAYVHYGLGNFVFGSATGPTSESGVLRLTLTGRRVDAATWVPVRLSSGLPAPLEGDEAATALADWEGLRDCADVSAGTERADA
jgi:poly-gamma-glutamate synthesis protein (capsule biosynthesis protein)